MESRYHWKLTAEVVRTLRLCRIRIHDDAPLPRVGAPACELGRGAEGPPFAVVTFEAPGSQCIGDILFAEWDVDRLPDCHGWWV